MDPGVRCHEMKANPTGYLSSEYECFLMSGCQKILLFGDVLSACTNRRFGRFYAEKWLPYAENLKLGRTLTSSKNRVRPSAKAVTYTSVLRMCVFYLAAVSRKSRVRNGCDFGKNRLTNRRSRQPRSARSLSVIVNLIDR